MKKVLFSLMSLMPVALMAQDRPFTITGDLGPGKNFKMELVQFTVSTGQKKQPGQAVDGKFTFKGAVNSERQIGQIVMQDAQRQSSLIFYLEPGNINISWPAGARHYKLSGTPLNKDLQAFNTLFYHALDSMIDAGESVNEYSKTVWPVKLEITKKFIRSHPGSPVGLDQLNQYAIGNNEPATLEAAYKMLKPEIQKSEKGIELANRIKGMRSGEVGDMAPVFKSPDTEGKMVSLTDFKGKYVLVDFWATWCMPCIAEFPHLRKAYENFKGKNFEILGVSLDRPDSKEKWIKMIKEENLVWKQVSDLKWWYSDAAFLYNVNSAPANFLVDPSGKIIAKNLRGEDLEKKLAEVLH